MVALRISSPPTPVPITGTVPQTTPSHAMCWFYFVSRTGTVLTPACTPTTIPSHSLGRHYCAVIPTLYCPHPHYRCHPAPHLPPACTHLVWFTHTFYYLILYCAAFLVQPIWGSLAGGYTPACACPHFHACHALAPACRILGSATLIHALGDFYCCCALACGPSVYAPMPFSHPNSPLPVFFPHMCLPAGGTLCLPPPQPCGCLAFLLQWRSFCLLLPCLPSWDPAPSCGGHALPCPHAPTCACPTPLWLCS